MNLIANDDDFFEERITSGEKSIFASDVLNEQQNWVNWVGILTCICDQSRHQSFPVVRKLCICEFDDSWSECFRDFPLKAQVSNDDFFLDLLNDMLIELSLKTLQILK